MSRQFLTAHTVDNAHIADVFCLAATSTALFSASGASTLHVHSTTLPAFPLAQSIDHAHKLGCHHVCTAKGGAGKIAASAGFGGEVKIWRLTDAGDWVEHWALLPTDPDGSDVWAVALSSDERYLAGTTHDGRVRIWDLEARTRIEEFKPGTGSVGSFALTVDLSRDGRLTASGHQDGSVYVFANETGRMVYALPGLAAKTIRAVAFSPLSTLLAVAGDAGVIAIHDMKSGEHVGNLSTGLSPPWITSLDFSDTGEWLLSGSMDGRVRVWSVETRTCVATHNETDKALWSVRWLPKAGRSSDYKRGEHFCTGGANRSITFYRESSGA